MKKFGSLLSAFCALTAITFIGGCQDTSAPEAATESNTASAAAEHGHSDGLQTRHLDHCSRPLCHFQHA